MADMLDITTRPESVKELHKIWESIDKDMPLFVESIENVTPAFSKDSCASKPQNRKRILITSDVIIITDSDEEEDEQPASKRSRLHLPPQNKTSSTSVKITSEKLIASASGSPQMNEIFADCKRIEKDVKEKENSSLENNNNSGKKEKKQTKKIKQASILNIFYYMYTI